MRIVLCLCMLFGSLVHAQNKEVLYDVTDLPSSLLLNPGADVKYKFHAGVPLLSQLHISAGLRGASIFDVFADDGQDINTKISNTLNTLTNKDYVTLTQQLEILHVGWRSPRNRNVYFSAGLYQELDLIAYFPKDLAVLAYRGNQDFIGVPFGFSSLSFAADLMTVYHFGYQRRMSKKLTFGVRAKLYSSMFNIRSTKNSGTFTTIETPQGNNIYQHIISNADVQVQTSGYASFREDEDDEVVDPTAPATNEESQDVVSELIGRAFLGGNIGVGIDAGFTYHLEDQWTVTGSVQDLGMIFHSKDVESYRAQGSYVFEGLETPITTRGGQDILDELEAAIPIDTLNTSYTAFRPTKLYGSLKYSFNRYNDGSCDCFLEGEEPPYQDAFGVQLFSQIRPRRPIYALTAFYYKRIASFLRTKVTYTIDDYSPYNIGFLLSTHFNKINFYISANNLIEYSNLVDAQGASVQLGFNVIM